MHKFLSFNYKISTAPEIYTPAVSDATFYGRGIFTTLAVYNSKPFQWEKHWRRLTENAEAVSVDLSEFSEEKVKKALSELIDRNGFESGRARISFFRTSATGSWQASTKRQTEFLITTADFRAVPEALCLMVSPYRVNSKSPLVNVKSCNYLENLLALENAKKNGYDETMRLNENGVVVSGAMANVFWASNGEIFTPSLETGALYGTTRALVLETFPVREKLARLGELMSADEIFLTSAGIGIARVGSLKNRKFNRSDVVVTVRKLFDELLAEDSND